MTTQTESQRLAQWLTDKEHGSARWNAKAEETALHILAQESALKAALEALERSACYVDGEGSVDQFESHCIAINQIKDALK